MTEPNQPATAQGGTLPLGRRVWTREWRKTPEAERVGLVLCKEAPAMGLPEEVVGSARTLRYIISSNGKDRYTDTVQQEGMDASRYHGVWLWAHDSGGPFGPPPRPPIGRSLSLQTLARGAATVTVSEVQFAGPDEKYDFADTCYLLAKGGFIPDCSIGFAPTKYTFDPEEGSYNFEAWELLEISLVPIGANTDATQLNSYAQAHRIDLTPIVRWATECLDCVGGEAGQWTPKAKLEAVARGCGFRRGVKVFDLGARDLEVVVRARIQPLVLTAPAPAPVAAAPAPAGEPDPPSAAEECDLLAAFASPEPAPAFTDDDLSLFYVPDPAAKPAAAHAA